MRFLVCFLICFIADTDGATLYNFALSRQGILININTFTRSNYQQLDTNLAKTIASQIISCLY